jgi:hypothetical protein
MPIQSALQNGNPVIGKGGNRGELTPFSLFLPSSNYFNWKCDFVRIDGFCTLLAKPNAVMSGASLFWAQRTIVAFAAREGGCNMGTDSNINHTELVRCLRPGRRATAFRVRTM